MLKEAQPVLVAGLFPALLDELLQLLQGVGSEEWQKPTVCAPWTVKDLAAHLLADELNILARGRDKFFYSGEPIRSWSELVSFINRQNEQWVVAARRLSPRLLLDLLRDNGHQVCDYFQSLDLFATGAPVDWAGPDPAPVWLDVAREYTERWHHQQQLREALDRPGLNDPRFLGPALAAFIRALPHTFRNTIAPEGAAVNFSISGPAGADWSIVRAAGRWKLYEGKAPNGLAEVSLPEDTAWRLFARVLSPEEALPQAVISGDQGLGLQALETVAIIV